MLPDAVGVRASVLLMNGYGGAGLARVRIEKRADWRKKPRIFTMALEKRTS